MVVSKGRNAIFETKLHQTTMSRLSHREIWTGINLVLFAHIGLLRMIKSPSMVVDMPADTEELFQRELKQGVIRDIPPFVFCDYPTTLIHDSIWMVLFYFETLLKLHENDLLQ
jgi:hypothetical protein